MTPDDLAILIELVYKSTLMLDAEQQNQVIQTYAYKLEECYRVSRDDLRSAMIENGLVLEEFCVGCCEEMPTFVGKGNPLCNECRVDVDSVG